MTSSASCNAEEPTARREHESRLTSPLPHVDGNLPYSGTDVKPDEGKCQTCQSQPGVDANGSRPPSNRLTATPGSHPPSRPERMSWIQQQASPTSTVHLVVKFGVLSPHATTLGLYFSPLPEAASTINIAVGGTALLLCLFDCLASLHKSFIRMPLRITTHATFLLGAALALGAQLVRLRPSASPAIAPCLAGAASTLRLLAAFMEFHAADKHGTLNEDKRKAPWMLGFRAMDWSAYLIGELGVPYVDEDSVLLIRQISAGIHVAATVAEWTLLIVARGVKERQSRKTASESWRRLDIAEEGTHRRPTEDAISGDGPTDVEEDADPISTEEGTGKDGSVDMERATKPTTRSEESTRHERPGTGAGTGAGTAKSVPGESFRSDGPQDTKEAQDQTSQENDLVGRENRTPNKEQV